ncbi:MAG: glycosyltransferase [Pseudomonadota bacterium]
MKVVFASHGSLGDLVPFLEIGKVLVRAGHRVIVATHAAHGPAVAAAGLELSPMRPDRPSDRSFHATWMAPRTGPAFIYRSFLVPAIADSDADLTAACRDADILVSVTLALAAPIVAARTGIPWRSAAFQPAMLFSALDPPRLAMLPFVKGKPHYNERILEYAKRGVEPWVTPLRDYRRAQGLGEYPDHPAFRGQHSPHGVLALYSPLFGQVPADAPENTTQTGQVLQSGGPGLSAPVENFLAAGPPPVVFTLGSASAFAARRFFEHSVSFAKARGLRALFLLGDRANLDPLRLEADMMAVTTAPYHLVFRHAALAVHQGGIGTIALGAAAGTPMVFVPFAHDQPDNAARANRAGLGPVVPVWKYRFRGGAAISRTLGSASVRQAVASAATQLASERGAEVAAAEILRAAQGAHK